MMSQRVGAANMGSPTIRSMLMKLVGVAMLGLLCQVAAAQHGGGGGPGTPVYADAAREEVILQRRMVTGELRAVRRAEVAVEEAGIVVEFAVREGDRIERGDVVLRIDDTRLRLSLDEVESELAEAQAALDESLVQVAYWTRESEVLVEASSRGAATDKELRDARYQAALSAAGRDRNQRNIERIQTRVAFLQDRVEDAVVRAPFDGVVIQRLTEIGAWVDEGDAVIELLGVKEHEAWLDVPQGLLPAVNGLTKSPEPAPEQSDEASVQIWVKVDASGERYRLDRLRVVPDALRTTRSFSLVGVVVGPEAGLLAGGSLVAYVPTGTVGATLTLSKDAVLRGTSGPFVLLVHRDESGGAVAVRTGVTVLFETEDRVAIAPGMVSAGDLVVTEGAERLRSGSKVEVREKPESAPAAGSVGDDREAE